MTYDQPSVFQPENLLHVGRRQRGRSDDADALHIEGDAAERLDLLVGGG